MLKVRRLSSFFSTTTPTPSRRRVVIFSQFYALFTGSGSLNASNTSSSHLSTKFSQLPNLHTFITSSPSNVLTVLAMNRLQLPECQTSGSPTGQALTNYIDVCIFPKLYTVVSESTLRDLAY